MVPANTELFNYDPRLVTLLANPGLSDTATDDPRLRDATTGTGERQEWRAARHGTHPILQKAAQPPSSIQPHEGWATSRVSTHPYNLKKP